MVHVKHEEKEIHFKVVFYGPEGAGKGTTLEHLHKNLENVSTFRKTVVGDDVVISFTHKSAEKLGEHDVYFHLCTFTGKLRYPSTKKLCLLGCDGIVFVHDSTQAEETVNSFDEIRDILRSVSPHYPNFPLVFQYNKADLSHMPKDWTVPGEDAPVIETSATSGRGVLETLQLISEKIMQSEYLKSLIEALQKSKNQD